MVKYSHSLNNDIGRKKFGGRDQGEEKNPATVEKWWQLNEASEWGMESVLDKAAVWTKFC